MKATEKTTLQAFLIALSQLDTALPFDLQQAIAKIGHALAQNQTDVIDSISDLVKKHPQLNELYSAARTTLQKQYQTQEQDKLTMGESDALALENVAVSILTADDFTIAAKQLLRKLKAAKDFTDIVFMDCLQKAVSRADARAISVLKALESRPLTIENLAYKLEMPIEQSRRIVQRLWNDGYIDTTTGGILRKILPIFKSRKFPSKEASVDYFTLTSRGYFHLHPVITFGQ
ncbi:MAG: hypothetical protein AB4426_04525 [Xenococcaceae cyanobacterium]